MTYGDEHWLDRLESDEGLDEAFWRGEPPPDGMPALERWTELVQSAQAPATAEELSHEARVTAAAEAALRDAPVSDAGRVMAGGRWRRWVGRARRLARRLAAVKALVVVLVVGGGIGSAWASGVGEKLAIAVSGSASGAESTAHPSPGSEPSDARAGVSEDAGRENPQRGMGDAGEAAGDTPETGEPGDDPSGPDELGPGPDHRGAGAGVDPGAQGKERGRISSAPPRSGRSPKCEDGPLSTANPGQRQALGRASEHRPDCDV